MSYFGWINWTILVGVMLVITLARHLLKGKTKGLEGFFLGCNSLTWCIYHGNTDQRCYRDCCPRFTSFESLLDVCDKCFSIGSNDE